jgi:hypothetical protein
MKRYVLVLTCAVCLSAAAPIANAATDVRFWHRKHKDSPANTAESESSEASQPRIKRAFLHRAKPSREQAAHSEATFGMTGPKSVGLRHPQPGPAGVGAR